MITLDINSVVINIYECYNILQNTHLLRNTYARTYPFPRWHNATLFSVALRYSWFCYVISACTHVVVLCFTHRAHVCSPVVLLLLLLVRFTSRLLLMLSLSQAQISVHYPAAADAVIKLLLFSNQLISSIYLTNSSCQITPNTTCAQSVTYANKILRSIPVKCVVIFVLSFIS